MLIPDAMVTAGPFSTHVTSNGEEDDDEDDNALLVVPQSASLTPTTPANVLPNGSIVAILSPKSTIGWSFTSSKSKVNEYDPYWLPRKNDVPVSHTPNTIVRLLPDGFDREFE